MNIRGVSGCGVMIIGIAILMIIVGLFSGGEKSIIEYVGKNYAYRGTFTNEASVEDGIDIFASELAPEVIKVNMESFLKPYMPSKLNTKAQYVMSFKDCAIVVSDKETFSAPGIKFEEKDKSIIALYPPKAAEKEYNESGGETYVHVYPDYVPYHYRHHRNRFVSVHFHPRYRTFYTRRYSSFGYGRGYGSSSRSYSRGYSSRSSSSSRSYGSSGFRSGGSSWGK